MSNLRDKYKSTSTAKLKNKIQEEDALVGSGDRAGYLSIDEGLNKFRIYPAHDPDSGDWYVLVLKHWLTIEDDNGKEKRTTVFNAKHHGGFKKDPCELYISGATKFLTDNEDDDAAAKIASLTDWKTGLTASASWLLYADKVKKDAKEFGLLEFNKSTRDGINKIGTFEEESEPVSSEPFTDPDEGICVLITYNSKAKTAKDKYSVTTGTKAKAMPLTDEELEHFDSQKPLNQMYKGYGIDDLTKALDGIKFFDEKFGIGYYDSDEWQERIEELTAMVKAGKGKAATKEAPKKAAPVPAKKAAPKKAEVEEEEEEAAEEEEEEEEVKPTKKAPIKKGDQFDAMDRDELTQFWADEDLAETATEMGVKLLKSDDEAERRRKVREVFNAKAAAATEEEETEEEAEEEEEEEQPKKAPAKVVTKAAPAKKPVKQEEEEETEEEEEEEGELSLKAIKDKIKANKGK